MLFLVVVFKANDKVSNEDVMKGTFWTSRESDSLSPVVDTIEACNKAAARQIVFMLICLFDLVLLT